jgi:ATP-dependent RNA helicase RhlE
MTFADLNLSQAILNLIAEQRFSSPFPIQKEAIPPILEGKNVLGIAQTGSGKTASFVWPIVELFQRKKPSRNLHLKCLILAPTRELAIQIGGVIDIFSNGLPIPVKHNVVFGGVPLNQQMVTLKNTEILVATPGRLLDLISTQSINLSKIEQIVIDEADKMMDLGFQDELDQIVALLPKKRQSILFSATMDTENETINKIISTDFVKIEIEPTTKTLALIQQSAYRISPEKKGPLLRYLIKNQSMDQVLIFVSAVRTADNVAEKLRKNGIQAEAIHSKKTQSARTEVMREFKTGKLRALVATDLASRGIDIHLLPFVINYELPRSPTDYIHRIGRTGRAEVSGEAISIICPEDEHHFKIIQKKMGEIVRFFDGNTYDLAKV